MQLKIHEAKMAQKKGLGPLTDEEVQVRMIKLTQIMTSEAQKEIDLAVTDHATDTIGESKKTLAAEPKQAIDEWVEKLRAFTERQTKIHCARLRRVAKLRILEAYGDIREGIKNEARERIKDKMSKKTENSDRILGQMLLQGLLRLMESKVLVHTTKADLERVIKHYATVTETYKKMTGNELKLMTSRHPLKDHYFGRIVISDKASSTFVDMNLFSSVDKVADEVFAHYAAYEDKSGTSKNWGMEALKKRGLHIMPRGSHIGPLQLDMILSTMRGDPRTQVPLCQIKDDGKKLETSEEAVRKGGSRTHRPSYTSVGSQKQHNSPYMEKAKQVTIGPDVIIRGMSIVDPGTFNGQMYGYKQEQNTGDEVVGSSNDLYNLDFTSTIDLLSQNPSRAVLHNEAGFMATKSKSISADKEAPKASVAQRAEKRSTSDSEDSGHSEFTTVFPRPSQSPPTAPRPSKDLDIPKSPNIARSPSPNKDSSQKKK